MEANPGTVSLEYLSAVRGIGINRLSLGVQSLNDAELALMGRIHTGDEARKAVLLARQAGLANLNLDLIYGLPGQSLTDLAAYAGGSGSIRGGASFRLRTQPGAGNPAVAGSPEKKDTGH